MSLTRDAAGRCERMENEEVEQSLIGVRGVIELRGGKG